MALISQSEKPDIILGDLNTTLDPMDRNSVRVEDPRVREAFQNFIPTVPLSYQSVSVMPCSISCQTHFAIVGEYRMISLVESRAFTMSQSVL